MLGSLTLPAAGAACSDTVQLRDAQISRHKLSRNWNREVYTCPAVLVYRYGDKLSSLGVEYCARKEQFGYRTQDGDAFNRWKIGADSYLPFRGKHVLWGNASYEQKRLRGITMCSTADFDKLYPQISADIYLHDSFTEEYRFCGGYGKKSERWNWGVSGDFRALDEYRKKDPRAANVVSELEVKMGASRKFGDRYGVFLGGACQKYKQSSSVKSFADAQRLQQLLMMGPSSYYLRFSNDEILALYKGYVFGVAGGLFTRNNTGPEVFLRYRRSHFDRTISKVNLTPISSLREDESRAVISWKGTLGGCSTGVKASGEYVHRTGIENLLGSANGDLYPVEASFEQYYSTRVNVIGSIFFEYDFGGFLSLGISPYGGIRNFDERNLLPSQLQKIHALNLGGDLMLLKPLGSRHLIVVSGTADFIKIGEKEQHLTDGKLVVQEVYMETGRGLIIGQNFRQLTTDFFRYIVSARYSCAFTSSLGFFLEGSFSERLFAEPQENHTFILSAGILF